MWASRPWVKSLEGKNIYLDFNNIVLRLLHFYTYPPPFMANDTELPVKTYLSKKIFKARKDESI